MSDNDQKVSQPDYLAYHQSLRRELDAIKDRIRYLVPHWATDGSFKESALRVVLGRHLPETLMVARGFVVAGQNRSTELDILIVDRSKPTLFKDGDLVVVTPDAVKAIVEVKTTLGSPYKIAEAMDKLAEAKGLCLGNRREMKHSLVWAGLFVYDSTEDRDKLLFKSLANMFNKRKAAIDGIAFGPHRIIKHFFINSVTGSEARNYWQAGVSPDLAATVFIGGLLEAVGEVSYSLGTSAWYPKHPKNHHTFYMREGDKKPKKGYPKW